jgi:hypothetical protein
MYDKVGCCQGHSNPFVWWSGVKGAFFAFISTLDTGPAGFDDRVESEAQSFF